MLQPRAFVGITLVQVVEKWALTITRAAYEEGRWYVDQKIKRREEDSTHRESSFLGIVAASVVTCVVAVVVITVTSVVAGVVTAVISVVTITATRAAV